MIQYQPLSHDDVPRIAEIDRAESIAEEYRVEDGRLVVVPRRLDAPSWSEDGLREYVERVRALLRRGGQALGAWRRDRLVGFATLDVAGVGGDRSILQLDMLYVSRDSRGQGIGRRLTTALADRARELGATALYISATPTRGTVDAYLRLGARLAQNPDPTLFALEPDDVHLVFPLD